jgi:hypothetical protein
MTLVNRIAGAAAVGGAIMIGSGLSVPLAQAGYIVTLEQAGNNVVATGSGTIDTTGLSFLQSASNPGIGINPEGGAIDTGTGGPAVEYDVYTGFTGPTSFGSALNTVASSGSGDLVGIYGGGGYYGPTPQLDVPFPYVSGAPLSDTATYDNATFTSLGVTPGTYEWTWGSGADADSFTLQIGTVPAPLIGHGLPVLLAVGGLLFSAKLLQRRS